MAIHYIAFRSVGGISMCDAGTLILTYHWIHAWMFCHCW